MVLSVAVAKSVVTSDIVPLPFASRNRFTVAPATVGSVLSSIVTVICWVTALPEPSVAFTSTAFAPRSLQSKLVSEYVMFAVVQLSVAEPWFARVASPLASNTRVMLLTVNTGSISSTTVTVML